MSDLYTPNPANNPAQITFPEDGDNLDASSYRVGGEALADTCENIQNGTCAFTGQKTFSGNVTTQTGVLNLLNPTTNIVPTGWNFFPGTDPTYTRPVEGWSFETTTGAMKWPFDPSVGIDEVHRFELQGIPNGASVDSINVVIDPANDADPTTRFRIRLRREALDGSGVTTVATVTDPLSGASYQAQHGFAAAFGHTIDLENYKYFFELMGESGGDSDPVTLRAAPTITYTMPAPDWARG